jgi:hypothetical protein
MSDKLLSRERYSQAFWQAHHEAWRHRELNHMGYSFDGAFTKQAAEDFSHFPLRARKFMA